MLKRSIERVRYGHTRSTTDRQTAVVPIRAFHFLHSARVTGTRRGRGLKAGWTTGARRGESATKESAGRSGTTAEKDVAASERVTGGLNAEGSE